MDMMVFEMVDIVNCFDVVCYFVDIIYWCYNVVNCNMFWNKFVVVGNYLFFFCFVVFCWFKDFVKYWEVDFFVNVDFGGVKINVIIDVDYVVGNCFDFFFVGYKVDDWYIVLGNFVVKFMVDFFVFVCKKFVC